MAGVVVGEHAGEVGRWSAGSGPGRASGRAAAADCNSLEYSRNSVTGRFEEELFGHELSKCGCDCWFCPDCCKRKGYELRARLVPILETFAGLLMVTFTVDPDLFGSPREAFDYMRERRCLGRTVQDLRRGGHLRSRRYFYVVEWQRDTGQVHYHVLFDASFIPFDALVASWSKHRPKDAGAVVGERPAFGTAWISKGDFEGGAVHAARYGTKYLVKVPRDGFPDWVMQMGKDCRVRRYGTSRGFWGNDSVPQTEPATHRESARRSYAERVGSCGSTVNVCRVWAMVDTSTGEVDLRREWIGELDLAASVVSGLPDDEWPSGWRVLLGEIRVQDVLRAIARVAGREVEWVRDRRGPGRGGSAAA